MLQDPTLLIEGMFFCSDLAWTSETAEPDNSEHLTFQQRLTQKQCPRGSFTL